MGWLDGITDSMVRWSGIPISLRMFQFVVIHIVNGFSIVNKAEVDVFLELSCFFNDPADVGNLVSGSSAFSKTSLSIRKLTVHISRKWMWFGAFPGAFGLGRAQPQRRGTSP